jgi:hypothetical protein
VTVTGTSKHWQSCALFPPVRTEHLTSKNHILFWISPLLVGTSNWHQALRSYCFWAVSWKVWPPFLAITPMADCTGAQWWLDTQSHLHLSGRPYSYFRKDITFICRTNSNLWRRKKNRALLNKFWSIVWEAIAHPSQHHEQLKRPVPRLQRHLCGEQEAATGSSSSTAEFLLGVTLSLACPCVTAMESSYEGTGLGSPNPMGFLPTQTYLFHLLGSLGMLSWGAKLSS